MADLPSSGTELVTTMDRAARSTSTNWRLVRSWRSASALTERRWSATMSGLWRAVTSNGMVPSSGAGVTSRNDSAPRTVVSRMSRRTAAAAPITRPTRRATV
ncbi:hypothetical protein [Phytohabitans suffuscus]|uniref:hypothetical protein n=1 Tax=Phytohabitans suffuscus TaxID=624315 RepID=UPI0015673591|nr:hypothetical protein [Phytohabitans suffuscus]